MPFILINRHTENIGLYFLIDFIGHHMDLVEHSFEVRCFTLPIIWVWKLATYIIFYVFVGKKFG